MILSNITLQQLCPEQGQPYAIISPGYERVPYHSSQMFCGRVNGVIFGKSYVLADPERGVFLRQSHRDYALEDFVSLYCKEIVDETRERPIIEYQCCFLGGMVPFGHFVFEFLYRLVAFEHAGLLHLPFVVYDDLPASWLSYLTLYGVENIVLIPRLPAAHFTRAWVTACPNYLGADRRYSFWDEGIHALRAKLIAPSDGPKRVFIGRRDAKHRRLSNEIDVWKFLLPRGFVYADFAGMDAAAQIAVVSNAEIIVCVVGSGTVMTQFAPKNCRIIEIIPPCISGDLASRGFAAIIGQHYARVVATQDGSIDGDMVADVAALAQALTNSGNPSPSVSLSTKPANAALP